MPPTNVSSCWTQHVTLSLLYRTRNPVRTCLYATVTKPSPELVAPARSTPTVTRGSRSGARHNGHQQGPILASRSPRNCTKLSIEAWKCSQGCLVGCGCCGRRRRNSAALGLGARTIKTGGSGGESLCRRRATAMDRHQSVPQTSCVLETQRLHAYPMLNRCHVAAVVVVGFRAARVFS